MGLDCWHGKTKNVKFGEKKQALHGPILEKNKLKQEYDNKITST